MDKWELDQEIASSNVINKKINEYNSKIHSLQRACVHPKGFTKSKILFGRIEWSCSFCHKKERKKK